MLRRVVLRPAGVAPVSAGLLILFLFLPFYGGEYWSYIANLSMIYYLALLSIVVLTGWVGQLSLGQAAFVGLGSYVAGITAQELDLPFLLYLPIAVATVVLIGLLIGSPLLRLRGIYFALATLAFALATDYGFFRSPMLPGSAGIELPRPSVGAVSFGGDGQFFYVVLAFSLGITVLMRLVYAGRIGRRWAATNDDEVAAAVSGVNTGWAKLSAFLFSVGIAGLAGALLAVLQRRVTYDQFDVNASILLLAAVVIGGVRSMCGAGVGAFVLGALPEIFRPLKSIVGLRVLIMGLAVVLLMQLAPDGLSGVLRRRGGSARRRGKQQARGEPDSFVNRLPIGLKIVARLRDIDRVHPSYQDGARAPAGGRSSDGPGMPLGSDDKELQRSRARPACQWTESAAASNGDRSTSRCESEELVVEGVSVNFGGLSALKDVDLQVPRGAIVGVIGPNGAGKTTLFNAISGLVPLAGGTVRLAGKDISKLPPHRRAQVGLGRMFQTPRYFSSLSVDENVSLPLLASSRRARRGRSMEAFSDDMHDLIEKDEEELGQMGMRQVELLRSASWGAGFLLADEPFAGLDQKEIQTIQAKLRRLRDREALGILLIEHNIDALLDVVDYCYVLHFGEVLVSGDPGVVSRNERVVEAYLGEVPV